MLCDVFWIFFVSFQNPSEVMLPLIKWKEDNRSGGLKRNFKHWTIKGNISWPNWCFCLRNIAVIRFICLLSSIHGKLEHQLLVMRWDGYEDAWWILLYYYLTSIPEVLALTTWGDVGEHHFRILTKLSWLRFSLKHFQKWSNV